jgi:hypothetical protein
LTPRPAINHGQSLQATHFKRDAIRQRVKTTLTNGSALASLINVIHARRHQAITRGGNFLRRIFLFQQNCGGINANSTFGA